MFFMSNPSQFFFMFSEYPAAHLPGEGVELYHRGLGAGSRWENVPARLPVVRVNRYPVHDDVVLQRQSAWRSKGAAIEKTCNNLTQAVTSISWGGLSCKNFSQGRTS
jgi:hypothetical protein